MISTDNDAVRNVVGRGRCQKYRKFKVQDKIRGVGTIYHKRVNLNIETLAAANVSIFGITLVAAANVSKYGNISSCYHPQPWELRLITLTPLVGPQHIADNAWSWWSQNQEQAKRSSSNTCQLI